MPVPLFTIPDFINNHLNPLRRKMPYWRAWYEGILSQADRLLNLFYGFINGSTDLGYWSNSLSYSKKDKVRTLFGVYESVVNSNLANNPLTDDGTNWIKVLDNFIGITQMGLYRVSKLSLEHFLNTQLQGVLTDNGFIGYKQPTAIDPGVGYTPLSDIFISYDSPDFTSFVSYSTEDLTSKVYNNGTQDVVFDVETYSSFTSYSGIINIPVSVFTALGSTDVATSIVMSFVNKYKRIGTVYRIVTY